MPLAKSGCSFREENRASASEAEQIDMVAVARKFLRKHPESCKDHSSYSETNDSRRKDGRGGKVHTHGSARCISAFLG